MRKTLAASSSTVSVGLRDSFSKELLQYTTMVQKCLNGEVMLGSPIKMPTININDILAKYVSLGQKELIAKGTKTTRAKSISAFTFQELLEIDMQELEGKSF